MKLNIITSEKEFAAKAFIICIEVRLENDVVGGEVFIRAV